MPAATTTMKLSTILLLSAALSYHYFPSIFPYILSRGFLADSVEAQNQESCIIIGLSIFTV